MLQPKHQLMKRGTLLGRDPRESQNGFTAIGFPDFAAAVSVIFSARCPAAVSDSETVFLCPRRLAEALLPRHASRRHFGVSAAPAASFTRLSF
ncbi:hypothetical protein [Hymenobacter agri]